MSNGKRQPVADMLNAHESKGSAVAKQGRRPRASGLGRALLGLLAVAVSWAAIATALSIGPAGRGLTAQYFDNPASTPPAAITAIDREISTETVNRRWGVTPSVFSVRWVGYLAVSDPGDYSFAVKSDDGARLYVDNRLVVDNSGSHEAVTKDGTTQLTAGSHLIQLDYVQAGGRYAIEWVWFRPGIEPEGIPAWRLSPRPVPWWAARTAQALEWAWWAMAALFVACGAWVAGKLGDPGSRARAAVWPRVAALVFFACVAVIETWPLATDAGHLSRNDNADTVLNEWTIAWVAHQAVHDPFRLFEANIFHPEHDTLAFSESMLVQSALAAPILHAGGSPVFAYNLVLLAGFVLSAFAMCLVVWRWTGTGLAGAVAGIVFAFSGHLLSRLAHLQALHVEFLPLALLALDSLLREPRARHSVALAGWFALQAFCSFYLFVMTTVGLAAAVLSRPADWWGKKGIRVAGGLAAAAVLASLVVMPYLYPYWRVHEAQGMGRAIADLIPATWPDYLGTCSRLDQWLLRGWHAESALFPGFTAIGLAVFGIAGGALRDARARMCAALGVAGVVVSFGPVVPGFSVLYAAFPALQGIRALLRFGYLGTVGVAVLAGYGAAAMGERAAASRSWAVGTFAVITLLVVESFAAPIDFKHVSGLAPIYRQLDGVKGAVVAELPMAAHGEVFANTEAMLHSTSGFYRLLNGYSGFTPVSYYEHFDALAGFPDAESMAALRRFGVTHVFVQLDRYRDPQVERMRRVPELNLVAEQGAVALFEVRRAGPPR